MDDVGRLIHNAGARESVDADRMERARERVAAHWENVVSERKAATAAGRLRLFAIAASVVAVIGLSMFALQTSYLPQSADIARIDRILGEVSVAELAALSGGAIEEETVIETGANGRIALRMAGGQSLRIDTSSRLVVHTSNHISLDQGAVYIDTEFASNPSPILVSTPMGTAQDVGTQFQVRLAGSMLLVGVRDGLVEVAPQGQQNVSVNKGRFLELALSGDQAEGAIKSDDPRWDWVETIAPEFDIEGATLKQFLAWYANEQGLDLNWQDDVSEEKAEQVVLSGSIDGANLDESLIIVRQIAPFEHRVDGDSIWVKVN